MEEPQKNNKAFDDFGEGCAGCGCLIIFIWIIFSIVSWGWHIHWVLGLLLLIILLGVK